MIGITVAIGSLLPDGLRVSTDNRLAVAFCILLGQSVLVGDFNILSASSRGSFETDISASMKMHLRACKKFFC